MDESLHRKFWKKDLFYQKFTFITFLFRWSSTVNQKYCFFVLFIPMLEMKKPVVTYLSASVPAFSSCCFCDSRLRSHFNPCHPSVVFHIETSHLICISNQMTGFYMKCNTERKWVNYLRNISLKLFISSNLIRFLQILLIVQVSS